MQDANNNKMTWVNKSANYWGAARGLENKRHEAEPRAYGILIVRYRLLLKSFCCLIGGKLNQLIYLINYIRALELKS